MGDQYVMKNQYGREMRFNKQFKCGVCLHLHETFKEAYNCCRDNYDLKKGASGTEKNND